MGVDDHTIHDINDGSTATFQSNCNVAQWSRSGIWVRVGFEESLAQSTLKEGTSIVEGGCDMTGEYVDQHQHHWYASMSGQALHIVADDGRDDMCEIVDDHTIHDINDGSTATFQSNCNVAQWSSSGIWVRVGLEDISAQHAMV